MTFPLPALPRQMQRPRPLSNRVEELRSRDEASFKNSCVGTAGPSRGLLQEAESDLRLRVGLRQDADRGLLQDRVARQFGRFLGDVDVTDP